jgi:hypothetical protein
MNRMIVSDAASRAAGKTPLDSCDSLLANPAAIDSKQAWEFDLKEPACSQCI